MSPRTSHAYTMEKKYRPVTFIRAPPAHTTPQVRSVTNTVKHTDLHSRYTTQHNTTPPRASHNTTELANQHNQEGSRANTARRFVPRVPETLTDTLNTSGWAYTSTLGAPTVATGGDSRPVTLMVTRAAAETPGGVTQRTVEPFTVPTRSQGRLSTSTQQLPGSEPKLRPDNVTTSPPCGRTAEPTKRDRSSKRHRRGQSCPRLTSGRSKPVTHHWIHGTRVDACNPRCIVGPHPLRHGDQPVIRCNMGESEA